MRGRAQQPLAMRNALCMMHGSTALILQPIYYKTRQVPLAHCQVATGNLIAHVYTLAEAQEVDMLRQSALLLAKGFNKSSQA